MDESCDVIGTQCTDRANNGSLVTCPFEISPLHISRTHIESAYGQMMSIVDSISSDQSILKEQMKEVMSELVQAKTSIDKLEERLKEISSQQKDPKLIEELIKKVDRHETEIEKIERDNEKVEKCEIRIQDLEINRENFGKRIEMIEKNQEEVGRRIERIEKDQQQLEVKKRHSSIGYHSLGESRQESANRLDESEETNSILNDEPSDPQ